MATKVKPKAKASAKKAAPAAKKAPAKNGKGDGEGVGRRKYEGVGPHIEPGMSDRRKSWEERMCPYYKVTGARYIPEHNKGLLLYQMPDSEWRVGRLSSTEKSVTVLGKFEDRAEATAFYQENREGNYGNSGGGSHKNGGSAKGKTSAKDKAPAKGKSKAKPKSRKRASSEDEADEFID